MNALTRNIPNFITCCNLGAGTLALIAAGYGTNPFWGLQGYQWAFILIGIGALADFLDGFAARLLHAYSNLGKELDSLCDLVTFGVAPALALFHVLDFAPGDHWLRWTVVLIPICGAVRLARFNIDTRQSVTFIGLPIPANAIFWIGYAALVVQGVGFLMEWYVFLPVLVIECWLMNSPVRMYSLKFRNWTFRSNFKRYLLILAAGIFCFSLKTGGLLWLIIYYVLSSIAFKDED